ncbi:MAG: VOC family protein, partial [Dehalococcoidia bacterium]
MTDVRATKALVTGVAPMFLVDDVVASAEWYRDTLGFNIGEYYSDDHGHDEDGNDIPGSPSEVFFVIVDRDGHRVMLGETVRRGLGVISNVSSKQYSSDAYFWCERVDEIFAHARASGAEFPQEPVTQFYGIREFQIRDLDGRVLTFGAP